MTQSPPLVSIVINSYNQAAYLEQTLLSVLGQDYPNTELLLVDGGSTDGSLDIIHKYQQKFDWWVSEEDSGQADGINKGLRRTKGDLVAWLNSDDYYLPGAISAAVRSWQINPDAKLIYGDVLAVDGKGSLLNRMHTGDYQVEELMQFHIINQPAVFMDRTTLESAGFLDLNYHYLLDHHLWLRIATQGKIMHVSEVWAAGRFHDAAKNIASAASFGEEAFRLVDWMKATPSYSDLAEGKWNRILAGAYRINARYLLDANKPRESLKSYWDGLFSYAPAVLPEFHRMVYAILLLLGLGGLKRIFFALRRLVIPVKMD